MFHLNKTNAILMVLLVLFKYDEKKTTLYALKLFKILDEHIPHKLVEYTDILY